MSAIPLRRIEGKYEILEKIQEGGMGAIYKVRHRLLDEVRVIKVMRPQLVGDQELRARFVREARVAIKLRHPNIAQLYDFTADEDGTAFIVMEFIRGRTLEELPGVLGPLCLGLILEIAQQALRALGYLHGKGFIHRDISPDNLMLTEDPDGNPQVKLIDLGITKVVGGADANLTQAGTFLGKVRYSSPEQFDADGVVTADARADLYSFGIVLYELLTGVYPITGRDPSSLIAGHLFRPPIPFEESDPGGRVPAGLRAIVLRALAKKAQDRQGSAQELARELAPFRSAGDLQPERWRPALEQAAEGRPGGRAPAKGEPGGTTQGRLDEQFGLEATPVTAVPTATLERVQPPAHGKAAAGSPPAEPGREPAGTAQPVASPGSAPPGPLAQAVRGVAKPAATTQRGADPALREARELLERRDFAGAAAALHEARKRWPRNREVSRLLGEAEAESQLAREDHERRGALAREEERLRALADQEARREALAAAVSAAEAALERRDWRGTETQLYAAEAEFGEQPVLQALHARLAEERRKERTAQHLIARARGLLIDRALAESAKALDEARRLEPGKEELEEIEALAAELAAARRREERELRRAEELARTAALVRERLDRGELVEASNLLDHSVARFGAAPALHELWEVLEQRRREELAGRVRELVAGARRLLAEGAPSEARERLAEAHALDPQAPGLAEARQEVEASLMRLAEGRQHAEALAAAATDVETCLDRGQRAKAARRLAAAVAKHGPVPPLAGLIARLETEERAEELMTEARLLHDLDDFEGAGRRLAQVLALVPEHAAAKALAPRVKEGAGPGKRSPAARSSSQPDSEELLAAIERIAGLIVQGEPDRALRELRDAGRRFGDRDELVPLRKALAAASNLRGPE